MKNSIDFNRLKIDVSNNEKVVIDYLNSLNIFERGNILSPGKDIWF